MRATKFVVAMLAWLGFLSGATAAAQTFSEPVTISAPGQHAVAPHVAVDAEGDALAVWLRSDGEHFRVQLAASPSGQGFGPPAVLSAPGRDAYGPQVAMHAGGDAIVTWCQSDGLRLRLYATVRRAGSSFTAPQALSAGDVDVTDCDNSTWGLPQAAFGPAGEAIAVWAAVPGGGGDPQLDDHRVQAAQLDAGGRSFGAARDISPEGWDARNPQVAVDGAGAATVLWRAAMAGTYFRIQAVTRPAGGGFGPVAELSDPSSHAELQRIAVDPAGNAVAVWNRVRLYGAGVEAAVRPAGGAFGPVQELSRPIADPNYAPKPVHLGGPVRVALDGSGNAAAVWREREPDGEKKGVFAALRPAGGVFGPAQALSRPGRNAGAARVAFDGAGNAVAVWRRRSDGANRFQVQAAIRPATGGLGAPQTLSADGRNAFAPQLAVDPAGNGTIVWRRKDGEHWRIQAVRYTPPAA
jgi:hypothetical protein